LALFTAILIHAACVSEKQKAEYKARYALEEAQRREALKAEMKKRLAEKMNKKVAERVSEIQSERVTVIKEKVFVTRCDYCKSIVEVTGGACPHCGAPVLI